MAPLSDLDYCKALQVYMAETNGRFNVIEEKMRSDARALDLQAREYERRLEVLNGEASRLAKVLAQSVPREVWDQQKAALDEWRASVDKALAGSGGRLLGEDRSRAQTNVHWGWVVAAVLSLLGLVIALLRNRP